MPAKKSKALVDAINKIFSDDDLAERFGKASYKRFKKHFDSNIVYKKYLKLYVSSLNKKTEV